MRGLDWQNLQLPLAAGVNQRADDRALPAPALAAAIDVQFDEIGGLQTRKPYAALGSTTATGTTISDARRIEANGSELALFTKSALYSWNDQMNRWVFRATHLAVAIDEATTFATPGDQYDPDRAELAGVVFYAWTDTNVVYLAATDKATGAVLLAPTAAAGTSTRPRLVALTTGVLLFWHAGTDAAVGNIVVASLDPTATNPSTWASSIAAPTVVLAAASSGSYFDAVRIASTDQAAFAARRAVTTSYTVATVTVGMLVTAVTKARTCDGPIAIASTLAGTNVRVVRSSGLNIQGDVLSATTLADVTIAEAIGTVAGTPVSQVTAAYRTDGRCYAFWTSSETAGAGAWLSKSNYVESSGVIGTQVNFIRHLGVASRAFEHDGSVFFWGAFGGESSFSGASPSKFRAALQNTYFLYRDDATLHAKAAATRGGGLAPSVGRVPGVALTSGATGYSWCATERRVIPIGSAGEQLGYDARAPRDVTFTFDSNDARRVARLGETLYVSGAEILQYDGVGLYEVGFHLYPWYFGIIETGTGNLAAGTYTYKVTWRWENAKGELDRSTTATHGDVTVTDPLPSGTSLVTWYSLYQTHKLTAKPIAVEVWRTAVNPPEGAPFFLITPKDPASLANPNRFVPNDPTASGLPTFNDEMSDTTAKTKETNPENGDVLENLAPPAASLIAATDTRLFLGGVAGDPDRVWYSKLRTAGTVASFHDALTIDVPKDGGAMTGLAFLNGILVVFRERATYMFPGDGFDNTSRGTNYGPPQVLSYDVGCRDTDSIVVTPEGIAFHSSKGKYLLTRGWTMKPIGLPVSDYDAETVVAAHIVAAQHQVRWVTASRVLVYDYLVDQWAEWSIAAGVHATVWNGAYHYLAAAGPLAEQSTFAGTTYGLDVETAWIKPADLQGAAAIRKMLALGEFRSAHYLRVRVAYDYKATWVDDVVRQTLPASAGLPLQREIRPSRQKVQAVKLRITALGTPAQATSLSTSSLELLTPSSVWAATLTATPFGTLGNSVTMTVGVDTLVTTGSVEVRDNQKFTGATGLWTASVGNVGVRVASNGSFPVTIAQIEAAINAGSALASVTTPHATPTATIDTTVFGSPTVLVLFGGGSFPAPTGESLKLTGLGLEVGVTPRLHKRFPRT